MAKLPFMKFFTGDWYTGTRLLGPKIKGHYIDLLCLIWDRGEIGKLRIGAAELANLWAIPNEQVAEILDTLESCKAIGIMTKTSKNGLSPTYEIYQKRIAIDQKHLMDNAKRQGKFREKADSSNGSSNALSNGSSNGKVTPQILDIRYQKTDKNKNKNKTYTPIEFDSFYQAYPRKSVRYSALKAWRALNPDPDLAARILASVRAWSKTDQWQIPKYIPHPATFLNQRRWEDEPPANNDASYETLKAKAREDHERVERILAGNRSGAGNREVVRPPGPKLAQGEKSDLDTGIGFEPSTDDGDFAGHPVDQDG